MELILGKPLKRYFLEHAKRDGVQYIVTKPLHVFKKLRVKKQVSRRAIANLIIPIGARVNALESVFDPEGNIADRKMRANIAIVHSIRKIADHDDALGSLRSGYSQHDRNFYYEVGRTVVPHSFSPTRTVCAPGIHFFLNLQDALYYHL
jgi:hypothetical protein